VTGEGQQQISIAVPATIPLQNGANTLTVATANNLPGGNAAQVLGGSLGGNASLNIDVGGTIALTSQTPSGVYAGSFTVTASYQ
jgi:hypothetical protein